MLTGLSLSPAPDVDGYRVYWDAGGTAVVETTGATDTVMAYYDGPGAPDVIDDDGGVDRNARISTSVSAQSEVWYGVEGYRATTTGSYGLTVDGPPAASTAITIDGDPSRGTATGSIDSAWDYDFFHFTTTAAGPWFVAIWPTGNWDPTMLVYDNLGNPVGGTFTSPIDDAAVGGFETWSASLSLGQTYYVRVENAALGAGGAYTLKVEGPDPDDQISEALSTAVGSTVGGSISASHDDVDMFSFTVSAGQTLGFDIDGDAASSLDSYIRVFDGNGVELAFNNRDMGPAPEPSLTESYLQYTFNTAGTYYIGVSSMFNTQYDPITGDDPMRSMTSGAYQLSITLDLPDLVGWSFDAMYHVTGEVVDAGGYVPVDFTISNRGPGPAATWSTLAFYVSDDDTITASDIRRGHVVVPALAGGGIYSGTVIVNLPDPDPFRTDNEYWVGVIVDSGDRIPEQDETNNANRGVLKDKDRIMSERHLPGPTDGNSVHATYLIPNVPESEDIGDDEWIGAYDQDILQFTPPAVGGYGFDIDRISGDLDSYLRIFDSSWALVGSNDDGGAPDEISSNLDSYWAGTLTGGRTYYVVVSALNNHTGDPRLLTGRSAQSTGEYALIVQTRDFISPTGSATAADITTRGGASHTFTVTYADNVAVDVSDIDNNDIRVTGPGSSQLATFVPPLTPNAIDGTPRTATYRINAP